MEINGGEKQARYKVGVNMEGGTSIPVLTFPATHLSGLWGASLKSWSSQCGMMDSILTLGENKNKR